MSLFLPCRKGVTIFRKQSYAQSRWSITPVKRFSGNNRISQVLNCYYRAEIKTEMLNACYMYMYNFRNLKNLICTCTNREIFF